MVNRWILVGLVAVVVAAAGLAQTAKGHALLQATGLFEKPATYTVLSFAHPQELPGILTSKNSAVNVSFVVHNVSRPKGIYQWHITTVRGKRKLTVDTGAVLLSTGASITLDKLVPTSCVGGRLGLVVGLAAPAESIRLWVTCWSRRRGSS